MAQSGKPDQSLTPHREVGPAFVPRYRELLLLLDALQMQK